MTADEVLAGARTVVVVDWPSRDVPDSLAKAGLTVLVHGGPEPDNWSAYETRDAAVVVRRTGRAPAHADLVYTHRPVDELPGITQLARELGASTVWYQSGLADNAVRDPTGCWMPDDRAAVARETVESAGLGYIGDVYIADVVRRVTRPS